jgi:cellulose synthase/poly-beta-1,6-N-acetylglucosamine synthase-like glycosyltransferase
MAEGLNLIIGIFLFISLFFEVFLLLTFLEKSGQMKEIAPTPTTFPSATVIVPCFNESTSITGTVDSLLALDYPADKLQIIIVDDGSTDDTWAVIQKYASHPLIQIYHKENGGKHSALNFALEHAHSDIIGC